MLDNLRDELSGLVEATQLRMLSQAIRTNQAQEEGQTITQKSELQATKAELEQVRAYMAEIKQKNRELQDLMDDAHAHWVEMSLLEESKEAELKRKDMELFRLRDELRQVKHEVGRLQKVAKDHEEEAEKKNQALQELKHNVEVYQSEIACLKDAKEDELRWKDMASLQVQNELRQVKSEVECLQKAAKGREAEIEEKNRAIQILTDDAHARWIEMSQLEDKKNYQLRQKDMTLLQLRNDLRQVRNEVKCLRKAAKDQKAEVEKKDLVFWQELVDDTQTHQREISRVEARKEELAKGQ
ncbi:hypothetical protein FRC07_014942 [Ceratobasidium sp. 392]|nr:hypothetical protein FRC07_014942 [Ceratobasidium sp. 392]